MALSRTVADGGNYWQLREFLSDAKRGEHRGDMGWIAQPDQMRKLRVKRPNLELDPLVEEFPPQFALDRHQTRLPGFFLQLTPTVGVVIAIQGFLPCNGEMNQMTCLAHSIERWEGEIS